MITNVVALESGDLAAQVAQRAIARQATSAAGLAELEDRMRRLGIFRGMSWMNNVLIRAPLELDDGRLAPKLLLDKELRRYLVP